MKLEGSLNSSEVEVKSFSIDFQAVLTTKQTE